MTAVEKAEKKTLQQQLDEVTAPVFTREIGARLRWIRMKLLLDQAALGEKLGLGQQQVSRLEKGRDFHRESPITVTKLKEILGRDFLFVMLGTGEDKYNFNSILSKYWDAKNAPKGNRTTYRMTEYERLERAKADNLSYVKPDKVGKH